MDADLANLPFVRIFAAAVAGRRCEVLVPDGRRVTVPVARWIADADASDAQLLRRCRGATIDIGCGPGRMTQALLAQGHAALGVDVTGAAVGLTLARGGMALQRDIFQLLPGEGRWGTALLADGNVGIGGDPLRLLRRVRELLAPSGRIVLDVDAPGGGVQQFMLSVEVGGARTDAFPWAIVPADEVADLAERSAMRVVEVVHWNERWFAQLERAD